MKGQHEPGILREILIHKASWYNFHSVVNIRNMFEVEALEVHMLTVIYGGIVYVLDRDLNELVGKFDRDWAAQAHLKSWVTSGVTKSK